MKIVTWNVNSLKVRLPVLQAWINSIQPDVIALQETKLIDAEFPMSAFMDLGYHVYASGQRTYNGVALLTRHAPCTDIITDIPYFEDMQRRLLAVTWQGYRIINVYIPNGGEIASTKYEYKLSWLQAFQNFMQQQLAQFPQLILLGDFNIAPTDQDVHDPKIWHDCTLVSKPERDAFQGLLNLGLVDLYRELFPTQQEFSWWDYRAGAFRRNNGLRIDHILVSQTLLKNSKACWIDKTTRADERPSDHAPVIAEF